MRDEQFKTPPKGTPVRYWRHEHVPGVEFAQTSLDAHAFAPRVESAYAFVYLKRGSASATLRGQTYALSAGALFLVTPGEVCAAQNPHEPWQAQAALVNADIAADITFDLTGRRVLPTFGTPFLPTHFAADFVAFWESVELPSSALERESRILILTGDVIETLGELPAMLEPDAEKRVLGLLRAHVWDRPSDELPLRELARSAQLSLKQLLCAFELEQGVDLETYQRLVRLALAKALLGRGRSLASVAQEVGLEPTDLQDEFERVYKLTPEVYGQAVGG